ncbi:MAG: VirB4 family type IV secretion/conjugal transfer ATPase [Rickettsiaceae bacterium]|nr:MAG: VirB4 family type IV secretion/conjugal transfer ATPase [Rickettsiaceae bacterium]
MDNNRKADKDLYNSASEDFIPVACHYDEQTLLTKNGELIQTIQINGINSEKVSAKLFNLREMVRNAIRNNVNDDNFAFWIHTVRRKIDLDDPASYSKILPANIHKLWREKNYWHDKFVNTLYISIIYDSAAMKITNFKSFINSLFSNVLINFQNKYLVDAHQKLNTVANNILEYLTEYGAVKLGISFDQVGSYSDLLFVYRRIIHLNEDICLLPTCDLSSYLASHQYAVGSDKIEVINEFDKKFAAILSIKEYQNVSANILDNFMQLPVELIATEIFYFVDKNTVKSSFEDQDYILKVSGDNELREIKGLARINSDDPTVRFCQQQISVMIIGDSIEKLENNTKRASQELSKIGIVHVREDINLEQTFWAQLPGNFTFLRRMTPTILRDTAALTSLHNFPTGEQYNPWGRAITLLRTEKGTPYFMNFHDKDNKARLCIFGTKKTGKTILLNFLISEATKFEPTIVYLTNNSSSELFIKAINGKWVKNSKNLINPLLCEDNEQGRLFVLEFLKIICNHYVLALKDEDIEFLKDLLPKIFNLETENRNLSYMLKNFDFSSLSGSNISARLYSFKDEGIHQGVFDNQSNIDINRGDVIAFNLAEFDDQYFTKQFYPQDKKLLEQFEKDLVINSSIRTAIIYALNYQLSKIDKNPKILAIDEAYSLIDLTYYQNIIGNILDDLNSSNGAFVANLNLSQLSLTSFSIWQKWQKLINIKIILPSDIEIDNLDEIMDLNRYELEKLTKMSVPSRKFLIKQQDQSIATELSIGGLIGIVRLLSAKREDFEAYDIIIKQDPDISTEIWVNKLYETIANR